MHATMPHDTRRGSSRYRGTPGYAEADAIDDHRERARALDALRHEVGREQEREGGVPTAHQVNAMLADAVGLALDPATLDPALAVALGRAIERAFRARGFDMGHAETYRRLRIRIRPQARIEAVEAQREVEREVAERLRRRREAGMSRACSDVLDAFLGDRRDDDE